MLEKVLNKLPGLVFLISIAYSNGVTAMSPISYWRSQHHVPAVVIYTQTPHDKTLIRSGIITDQLFGVGSITKTFISALILDLESKQKLSIYDPIGQYFPQYPRWRFITIKQLLNMTSGIFNYMNDKHYTEDLNNNFSKNWNTDSLIELAYHHPDDFTAGKDWNYTNTAYLLLGKIIEKVTHQSIADVLSDRFFKPLGMRHTIYVDTEYPDKIFRKLTPGYYNNKPVKAELPGHLGAAAGGMIMNINDLAIFINHLLVIQDLLPKKQLQEFLSGVPIPEGKIKPKASEYGLGVTITQDKLKGDMIWYTGVTPYHTSIYLWIPKTKELIIAMAAFNRNHDTDYDLLFPCKDFVKSISKLAC